MTFYNFTKDEVNLIHQCIREVTWPTHLSRLPNNLGEKKHGKLKAIDYLHLFTMIYPLVLPEIWLRDATQQSTALFNNFVSLIAATNIISSYSISSTDPDAFMQHYVSYRRSLEVCLFSNF